jgi:hypothetical protein
MNWKKILKAELQTKTDRTGKKYSYDPSYNGGKQDELERMAMTNPNSMPTEEHGFQHTSMGHQSYSVRGPDGKNVHMCLECGVRYFRQE